MGEKKTKLMLYSTFIVVVVEVEVELGKNKEKKKDYSKNKGYTTIYSS